MTVYASKTNHMMLGALHITNKYIDAKREFPCFGLASILEV